MKIHPLALMIPPMKQEEYESLKSSIKGNGLLSPITVFEEKILDGRHRFRACSELGIKPRFENFHENGVSAHEFVSSQNLTRRHLTVSQLACCAALLYERLKMPARARLGIGIKTGNGTNHKRKDRTDYKVGRIFGIGQQSVSKASTLKNRSPRLFKEVFEGKVKLNVVYKQVREIVPKPDFKTVIPKDVVGEEILIPQVFSSLEEIMSFHRKLTLRGFQATIHCSTGGLFACKYWTTEIPKFNRMDYCLDIKTAIVVAGRQALNLK